jgi:hypothetical protein
VRNVKFNYECNAYNGYNYLGSWIEPIKSIPNNFLFRYDILYDSDAIFNRGVELELDSIGNYILNEERGFERLLPNSPRVFSVNNLNIIEKAKEKGLTISDTTTYFCFLTWESLKINEFYNGNYRYYLAVKYDEIKQIGEEENGRSRVTERFMVYIFNPWTGKYLETKKMKSVREWGKVSGFSTGLIPDK